MKKKINIKNVGTEQGDCFFIEIGTTENEEKTVIVVDSRKGKRNSQTEIENQIIAYKKIDCLVITHIDADHISGVLQILKKPDDDEVKKIIEKTIVVYNYVTRRNISYRQAEEFENLLRKYGVRVVTSGKKRLALDVTSSLGIISFDKREKFDVEKQPCFKKQAIMTLLYPDKDGIIKVNKNYRRWKSGEESTKSKLINANSLVFLLEYGDWKGLLTGDCFLNDIVDRIGTLKGIDGKQINFLKIPHHGAKDNNKGLSDFAVRYQIKDFMVSGNQKYDGKHPSKETLEELEKIANKIEGTVSLYTNIEIKKTLDKISIDKSEYTWKSEEKE